MSEIKVTLAPLLILAAVVLVAMVALDNWGDGDSFKASPSIPASQAREPIQDLPVTSAPVPATSGIEVSETRFEAPRSDPEPEIATYQPSAPVSTSYSWYEGATGFRNGVEEAQREGKALVVYFYTDWCPYCRELERELLGRGTVENYLKFLVKIRVNPEQGANERALADRYGVRGYPSFFVQPDISSRPRKIQRTAGDRLKTPEEFVTALERAEGSG